MRSDPWSSPSGHEHNRRLTVAVVLALLLATAFAAYRLVTRTAPASQGQASTSAGAAGTEQLLDPAEIVDVLPQDAIPALDEPGFESVPEVGWLDDQEPVITLEIDGEARAYPLQIMTWHEIVNDEVADTPVAVTFCPLCNTAIAFERPEVEGEVTTFGTSGKLINSNLLMYDRATESLWPQVTGQALTGELQGRTLERIPAQIVSWADFRTSFPEGDVLSRETGFDRRYGDNPYPGYDDVDNPPFLFRGEVDGRLAAVERVLGVRSGDKAVAFPYFRLQEQADGGVAAVNAEVGGEPVIVLWRAGTRSALDQTSIASSREVGSVAAFSRKLGGKTLTLEAESDRIIDLGTRSTWDLFGRAVSGRLTGKRLRPVESVDSFWFDWAAFHPDTSVWQGG